MSFSTTTTVVPTLLIQIMVSSCQAATTDVITNQRSYDPQSGSARLHDFHR